MKFKQSLWLVAFLTLNLLFSQSAMAQRIEISGTVRDQATNETIPGVNVQIKGTTTGTVTDINGYYEINAEVGSDLVFTFVGMQTREVAVDRSTTEINVALESEVEILEEFVVAVSSIARDRETPVAISTISAEVITERLGSQEFPEILKSTPSVYATKDGGGFGDGRINMRGFDSNNVGVLINGVPVNDMENGRVYWSNWAGLSDVTQTMQVQRGLGASRLAISSVGGTINIVTKTTDAKKGGSVFYGFGHDGYQRRSLSLSTGKLENGWALTALGGRTTGQGFVDGTEFDGWSYFLNVSKELSDKHIISFTAFGAPQWHNQRWPRRRIQTYRDHPDGIRYNPSVGIRNGERFSASYNEYHKPQISLNHYWSVNPTTTLSTALYTSISSGGGRRIIGSESNLLQWDRFDDPNTPIEDQPLTTPEGYLDFDAVAEINRMSASGSRAVIGQSVNEHDWYGSLSTLQKEVNNWRYTGGLDLRYYKGYHYQKITDLLGGSHFEDNSIRNGEVISSNINRDPTTRLKEEDKIVYNDTGEVLWSGLFAQAEYVTDTYSAFVSGTASQKYYRRTDFFSYADDDPLQQTDWVDFTGWSLKGGVNYNINEYHNVFANTGYFTRAPFFRFAFIGFTNVVNQEVNNEDVFTAEVGYGLRSKFAAANVVLYRTEWLNKALVRNLGQNIIANITGLDALHQGVEVDFTLRPTDKLQIRGMFSYGDWVWQDDLVAEVFDENQVLIDSVEVYGAGLKVGNSAQTTAALGVDYEILEGLRIGFDANHYDRLWADFNVEDRGDIDNRGVNSWRMPDYQLFDFNVRYRFKIAGLDATLISNINNIFDTEVIRDATDGTSFDYDTALVFYGWGRTWTTSLSVKF